jgi:hypothetical protein
MGPGCAARAGILPARGRGLTDQGRPSHSRCVRASRCCRAQFPKAERHQLSLNPSAHPRARTRSHTPVRTLPLHNPNPLPPPPTSHLPPQPKKSTAPTSQERGPPPSRTCPLLFLNSDPFQPPLHRGIQRKTPSFFPFHLPRPSRPSTCLRARPSSVFFFLSLRRRTKREKECVGNLHIGTRVAIPFSGLLHRTLRPTDRSISPDRQHHRRELDTSRRRIHSRSSTNKVVSLCCFALLCICVLLSTSVSCSACLPAVAASPIVCIIASACFVRLSPVTGSRHQHQTHRMSLTSCHQHIARPVHS